MALTPTPSNPYDVTTSFGTVVTFASAALLKGVWISNYSSAARQVGLNRVASGGTATNANVLRPYSSSTTITAGNVEYWAFDMPCATGDTLQAKSDSNSAVLIWVEYGLIS